jgi:uncharacterized membrane protein
MAPSGHTTSHRPWFRPRDLLDQTFKVGIILKGLDGVLEVIGGLLLLVVSPVTIDRLVTSLTQHELSEDPHDFVATHLLKSAHGLTGSAVLFGAIYLLAHGVVKVILVAALLKNRLWAYPWMIGFLGVFIVYQLYRLSLQPSLGLTALTIFDAAIAWLTYREYHKQLAVARVAGEVPTARRRATSTHLDALSTPTDGWRGRPGVRYLATRSTTLPWPRLDSTRRWATAASSKFSTWSTTGRSDPSATAAAKTSSTARDGHTSTPSRVMLRSTAGSRSPANSTIEPARPSSLTIGRLAASVP